MFADALYVGDSSVDRVMLGDVEVWSSAPSLPVVHITGTSGNTSRDQFRAACTAYGVAYNTVVTLPFLLDTSAATNMEAMFYGCSTLTTVPDMDTSKVTNMAYMFFSCSKLTSVPDMDASKVTTTEDMFYNCSALVTAPVISAGSVTNTNGMFTGCASLTHVPDMNTVTVTNAANMFSRCSSLTNGNVRLIGKHPSVLTSNMITGSGLTRLPFYDTAGNPI